jgi:hypothetical protein
MVASSMSSLSQAFDMSQTDLEQSGHANLSITFQSSEPSSPGKPKCRWTGRNQLTGSAPPFLSSTLHELYDHKVGQKHRLLTQISTADYETG